MLIEKLLKLAGKNYTPDKSIPTSLVLGETFSRVIQLIRGLLVLRKKVFVGRRTSFRGKKYMDIGKHSTIGSFCKIDGYSKEGLNIGHHSKIGDYSVVNITGHFSLLGKGLKIGDYTGIGEYAYFGAAGGIEIGDNVIMGQYISFHSQNHNFADTSKLIREQGVTSKGIKLGNNIWVGSKVTFLDGSSVGDNCVVAAGAVVTKEFPANSIIGGVPAKIIKTIV